MTDEIEWGEWGPAKKQAGDCQMQNIGDVQSWRYPVKREPVVETVHVNGGHEGPFGWTFQENVDGSGITHRITLTIIDGVVQRIAYVEDLA